MENVEYETPLDFIHHEGNQYMKINFDLVGALSVNYITAFYGLFLLFLSVYIMRLELCELNDFDIEILVTGSSIIQLSRACVYRPQRSKPTWRCFRQRATSAGLNATTNSGVGSQWSPAM